MVDYFMGRIDAIDEEGILVTHPITKCKNYIFMKYMVSIAEEQYTEDPEIIEQYKKPTANTIPKDKPPTASTVKEKPTAIPIPRDTPYVDPKGMAELAKKAREAFKK